MTFQNNQSTKWQQMQMVVDQHPDSLPPLFKNKNQIVIGRLAAENIMITLLQYVGIMFVMTTTVPSPIWLASGTACAFIFMRGLTIVPGMFLGTLLAALSLGTSAPMSVLYSAICVVQTLGLFWVTQQLIAPSLLFHRVCPYLAFIVFSGVLTAIFAFLLSSISYLFTDAFIRWWLADWSSVLVFGIGLVTWDAYFPELDALKEMNKWLLIGLYGLLTIMTLAILYYSGQVQAFLLLATTCLMIMISLRYGWAGAIAANCLICIIFSLASFFHIIVVHKHSTIPFQLWLLFNMIADTLIALWITSASR